MERETYLAWVQAPSAKAVTAMPAAKEGNITGTDKDLRRLTMKESKVILMKMGLTEDEVKGMPLQGLKILVNKGSPGCAAHPRIVRGPFTYSAQCMSYFACLSSRLCMAAGLSRWQRIAAVRDLSSAAAGEEGGELGKLGLRYARSNRTSADEAHRARKVQAQQIFERQVRAARGVFSKGCVAGRKCQSRTTIVGFNGFILVSSWNSHDN